MQGMAPKDRVMGVFFSFLFDKLMPYATGLARSYMECF